MKLYKICLLFTILVLVSTCFSDNYEDSSEYTKDALDNVVKLADAYINGLVKYFPEYAINYNLEDANYSGFSDNSISGFNSWYAFEDSLYAEFKRLPEEYGVGEKPWYIYGILKEILESGINLRICRPELTRVSHLSGWHVKMASLCQSQPVGTEKAREEAILRWSLLGKYVDNEIDNLKLGLKSGYSAPKDIVAIVIGQLDALLMEPPELSDFYSPAKRDSNKVFQKNWKELVLMTIYPAIKKYRDYLQNYYYPAARSSISLADVPDGTKCFEAYFRYHTSLKRSASDIYTISEYSVKINDSKLKIFGKKEFNTDSIRQIIKMIQSDTTEYFKTKDEILAFIRNTIEHAEEKCAAYFNELPKSNVKVLIIPEKDEDQQGSYFIPSVEDTSKPSVYHVNLKNPEKRLKGGIETEIFHETFPGHHLQLGLSIDNKNIHPISKLLSMTGYIEGWAGYAQILAEEMGLYTSGYSRLLVLGRSSRIMYVEACINAKRWTREQAVDYLLSTGTYISEQSANQILDRMIAWPGQYSTYDIGLIEILELREQAMLTLGDKFNIKEFHNIILEDGAIPLEMLREKVNWWLESKKNK